VLSAIEVREFRERWALVAAASTTMDALGDVLAELFPKLCADASSRGVSVTGNPFTRYGASQADGTLEIEACLPIALAEGVESIYLQACRAATVSHFGPYDGLGDAHFALGEYVRQNQLETVGLCWEEYVTDPGAEPDPSRWQTLVCWPVK
jgi:AraC family transcriptional regulator